MNDIQVVPLGEYITEQKERVQDRDLPVLSVTNSGGFKAQGDHFSKTVHSKSTSNYKYVRRGQFAYNPSRVNVGSIDLLDRFSEGALSPMYVVFETKAQSLLPEYLYQFTKTMRFRGMVNQNTAGTVRASLSFESLSKFPLFLPSVEEQRKIVRLLGDMDKIISNNKQIIEECELLKKGIMERLFSQGVAKAEHTYGFSRDISSSWQVKKIGDIFQLKSGGTPSRSNSAYFTDGTIHWVKTLDLNNSHVNHTQETITEKAVQDSSCSVLPVGSVLIAMYGGFKQIGRTGILSIPAATNQAITALLPNPDVLPEFLNYWFIYQRPLWRKVATSSRKDPNITKDDIKNFVVAFPDIEEQRSITNTLTTLDSKISLHRTMLAEQRALKDGLLQDLLSGKVRT